MGQVIYWVKGSVHVLFWNLHSSWESRRKERECKFQNKAHWTFDPRNILSPVHVIRFPFSISVPHIFADPAISKTNTRSECPRTTYHGNCLPNARINLSAVLILCYQKHDHRDTLPSLRFLRNLAAEGNMSGMAVGEDIGGMQSADRQNRGVRRQTIPMICWPWKLWSGVVFIAARVGKCVHYINAEWKHHTFLA